MPTAVTLVLVAAMVTTALLASGRGGRTAGDEPVVAGLVPAASTVEGARSDAGAGGVVRVSADWAATTSAATGVPARALVAYGAAGLRIAAEQPGCHLGWNTLAGIGAVESGHGTHGDGGLDADGRTTVRIVGPALDGTDGNAAIAAHPGFVRWHGDERWDHAVGPLQFIGSTWERWGADGDGDGTADPHDLDDAALAAARYLCHGGGDLRTPAGWTAAVHSYNHSDSYVRAVLAAADAVARTAPGA